MRASYVPCAESEIPADVRFDGRDQGNVEVAYGSEHAYKRVHDRSMTGPYAVRYYKRSDT